MNPKSDQSYSIGANSDLLTFGTKSLSEKQTKLEADHDAVDRVRSAQFAAIPSSYSLRLSLSFLAIIPAIARRIVDNTTLHVYSAQILSPNADQFTFILHISLDVPRGLRIRTDPLNLSLFNRDVTPMEPYLTVALPGYSLRGKTELSITRNVTDILNMKQFVNTLASAVYNKSFTISAKGSTIGHLGALKTPLIVDKDIELKGLNKLSGFSIDSARLIIPKEADGTNLVGVVILPNYSVFTFALGKVTLNLQSSDMVIGQATLENVVLKPGNNSVSLRGQLDMDTVIDNLPVILSTPKSALMDGELELNASGNSTIYDGKHIAYYEKLLNNLTITTKVPILMILLDTVRGLLDTTGLGDGNGINITTIMGDMSKVMDTALAARSLKFFMDGCDPVISTNLKN
ncbi:uncharacterized protein N7446_000281 [Penicillium canescens]|uniref:uncharacterized protein n=1 Tax=Penicillium canescens TaxID=5083 RepID=UPI0026DEBDA1|nr:uncharacterized protein N7446_000281 [Penicillium canescens]KAJ6077345.1 hypothetical protein N7446_000281 [Penicillium canescens]